MRSIRSMLPGIFGVLLVSVAAGVPFQAATSQVLYYPFDEAAGPTAFDASGNGLNGTYNGTVVVSGTAATDHAPVPGTNQRSLNFTPGPPEPGAFVSTPDAASLRFTGPFTAAAWIRPTAYAVSPANNWSVIVGKWDWVATPGVINGWGMQLANDGKIFMFNGTTLAYTTPWSNGIVPLNQWTHVAVVFDGAFNRIYINGAPDMSVASTAAPGPSNSPTLVGGDGWIRDFTGNIDEVRLFSTALSAAEIAILHSGLPAPAGVTATPGPELVTLTWNPVANATSYTVYMGTVNGGPYPTNAGTTTGTTMTVTNIYYPTPYYFVVVANGLINSGYSAQVTAVPDNVQPRYNDHAEGTRDGNCTCGTASRPAPLWALGLGVLLMAAFLIRR